MKYFLIILFFLLAACSQEAAVPTKGLTVMTWNLYNMFDGSDDGTEYAAYRPSAGYTARDFTKRTEAYSAVLRRKDFEADIIILEEVENEKVLEALLDSGMRRRGYVYYGVAGIESPISVGFISKLKPTEVNLHGSTEGRAFLSLEVMKGGRQYLIIGLHAKSNLGDKEDNLTERRVLSRHIRELVRAYDNVIIAGDFNSVIRDGDMLSRTDDGVALHVVTDTEGIPYDAFYDGTEDLYRPLSAEGTYCYLGKWYYYDKILVSDSIVREAFLNLEVKNVPELCSEDGRPRPYDNASESGYSDHFAVRLSLEY